MAVVDGQQLPILAAQLPQQGDQLAGIGQKPPPIAPFIGQGMPVQNGLTLSRENTDAFGGQTALRVVQHTVENRAGNNPHNTVLQSGLHFS